MSRAGLLHLRRREFLIGLGAAGTVACVPPPADKLAAARGRSSVAIVGGGIAGLHCCHRLKALGIDATLFEAQGRLGGRIFTDRTTFAAQDGQHCELGGELIDTPHLTMLDLCEEFSLPLIDYRDDDDTLDTLYAHFGGARLDPALLLEDFSPLAAQFDIDVTAADSSDGEFERLDALSIADYFDELVSTGVMSANNSARQLLEVAYNIEYGLEVDEQSALNLLYLVGTDQNAIELFGASDELLRLRDGNDALISALVDAVADRIETDKMLVRLATTSGGRHKLSFADGDERVFDRVVLALPFSVLREVDLTEAALSEQKRFAIDSIGYGTNAKLMLGFDARVWRTVHNSNGESFTDLAAQCTWETSRLQPGSAGILTNYTGGASGIAVGNGTAAEAATRALADLEQVFPGVAAAHNDRVARFHWPTHPYVKASYACYRPGQWLSLYGTEGEAEGTLHFCGEHTSLEAQGYMEGGAETGARCAVEVADAIGGEQALLTDGAEARILARARRRP
jgi:monoamine oxidase